MWTLLLLLAQAGVPAHSSGREDGSTGARDLGRAAFDDGLAPFLRAHCFTCHGESEPKGGLDVGAWIDEPGRFAPTEHLEALARIRTRLLLSEMPPAGRRAPRPEDVDRALDWLEGVLPSGPARRPTLLRLNAAQYERTVRDLFGVAYDAREEFPPDDVGAQFDNDAAVASASELAVERWVDAAERVAALALPSREGSTRREFGPEALETEGKASRRDSAHALYSAGVVTARVSLPRAGRYRLEVRAFGDRAGDELPRLALEVDGAKVAARDVRAERGTPQAFDTLEATATIAAGEHSLGARFVNDFYVEKGGAKGRQDRNAYVAAIALEGPLDPPPETAFTRFVDARLAQGSFEDALAAVGLCVWRRPLSRDELARLAALDAAALPLARLRTALAALLASPNFVYRIETSAPGTALTAHELAVRLSYFLWASAPDEALFERAAAGDLADPAVLGREIRRMLRDARASALAEDFAAQWLGWRALGSTAPDRSTFPGVDAALLQSMRRESELFFEAMLREDRPLDQFLRADFAFVDERLARHYGLPGVPGVPSVSGEALRRVHVADGERGGLLRQAALLTATSNPTRTSPVKRGKWILETLLGSSVPPPPPGVGVLEETPGAAPDAGLRERLELHRAKAECAACHARLDPLGFALEGFDAVGRRRSDDDGRPLDLRGTLPDGTALDGAAALERHLLSTGAFPRALARALFSYAMGRAPERDEIRALSSAVDLLPADRRTLAAVIEIVCRSPAFLRAEGR